MDGTTITPINVADFVRDPDGQPLSYALAATTPAWVMIDPATGQITGTPPANASLLSNSGTPGRSQPTDCPARVSSKRVGVGNGAKYNPVPFTSVASGL